MAETNIAFEFDGPDARAEADELAAFLDREWADWPTEIVQRRPGDEHETVTRGEEYLVWIALLLAAPAALKNVLDLADRIQLKPKVERLLAWARRRRETGQPVPRVVLTRTAPPKPLDDARLDEILDAIAADVAQRREPTP